MDRIKLENARFHLFTTNIDLKPTQYEAVYKFILGQIKHGVVLLDKNVKYEGLK